jgi:hypothetical protein
MIGHVAIKLAALSILVHDGIDKLPLALTADPVIETWSSAVVETHMEFADERRLVTSTLTKDARKREESMTRDVESLSVVVDDSVRMRV